MSHAPGLTKHLAMWHPLSTKQVCSHQVLTVRDGVQRQPPLEGRQLVQAHAEPACEERVRAEHRRPMERGRPLDIRAAVADRKVPYGHAGLPRHAGGLMPQAHLRDVPCAEQRVLWFYFCASKKAHCTGHWAEGLDGRFPAGQTRDFFTNQADRSTPCCCTAVVHIRGLII